MMPKTETSRQQLFLVDELGRPLSIFGPTTVPGRNPTTLASRLARGLLKFFLQSFDNLVTTLSILCHLSLIRVRS